MAIVDRLMQAEGRLWHRQEDKNNVMRVIIFPMITRMTLGYYYSLAVAFQLTLKHNQKDLYIS